MTSNESPKKICSRCSIPKPLEAFHRSAERLDGHASHCKDCDRLRYRSDVAGRRAKTIFRRYGISIEQYDDLFAKQGGLCLLCRQENRGRGVLGVDHDHETGIVRGLLCFRCNTNLAWAEQIGLDRLSIYLTREEVAARQSELLALECLV